MKIKTPYRNLILIILILVISGCRGSFEDNETPVKHTEKEALGFLVDNSDLIALVTFSGGTNKSKPLFKSPDKVSGKIHSIIKGDENRQDVDFVASPKYVNQGIHNLSIILRNGYHLVFACKVGKNYQPTTAYSFHQASGGKIWPIWKPEQYNEQGPNGRMYSSGIDINKVIPEIETEIKRVNKSFQQTQ